MPNETAVSAAVENEKSTAQTKAAKPETKRRKRLKPDTKGMGRLTVQALSTLYQMMTDESLKPSDRLSAVKAALDYASKFQGSENDSVLTVIFDNFPKEYAE